MESINQKIAAIIHHFHFNNYAFSKRIGVTGTTIDSIVNGRPQANGTRKKTKPGYDVLSSIINEFDINPDYLFGKSSIMLKADLPKNPTYSGMPKIIASSNDDIENIIYVPAKARAGYLNGYGDPEFMESLPNFHMPQLRNGTFRCFEVQGNSMLSTFYDGDFVFGTYVEDLKDLRDGRVYLVVSKNDGIVLKRVINRIKEEGSLILKSDNQDGNYPDFKIPVEDILEIWYVTMYASKQMPEPSDVYDKLKDLEHKIANLEHLIPKN
ncbi:S24 family peptidase [Psychroserpens sp. BH13MA-6]